MKYNIRKNWLETVDFITRNPAVLMPFIIIAFAEALAVEFLFFSTRFPISAIAAPLIRKFFGEAFIHYPGNLLLLPSTFYYAQLVIYVLIGVFLSSVAVHIFKNTNEKLPVKPKTLIQNSARRYASFVLYAILFIILVTMAQKANAVVFTKITRLAARFVPGLPAGIFAVLSTLSVFVANIAIQALIVLTVPIIVIEKSSLIRAMGKSIYTGITHFLTVFTLIFLPFLLYLPVNLLKSFSSAVMDKTFPEAVLLIISTGIIVSALLDCFVIVCVSKFLIDLKAGAER